MLGQYFTINIDLVQSIILTIVIFRFLTWNVSFSQK